MQHCYPVIVRKRNMMQIAGRVGEKSNLIVGTLMQYRKYVYAYICALMIPNILTADDYGQLLIIVKLNAVHVRVQSICKLLHCKHNHILCLIYRDTTILSKAVLGNLQW